MSLEVSLKPAAVQIVTSQWSGWQAKAKGCVLPKYHSGCSGDVGSKMGIQSDLNKVKRDSRKVFTSAYHK